MALSEGAWKALDVIVKGVGAALISGAITFYGMTQERSQQEMTEANRQAQALVEITSKQKDLDLNLGMRMFEALLNHYLVKGDQAGVTARAGETMLLLRLMALNFQDVPIHMKPLFEQLDGQLTDGKEKERLRDIAKEVAGRQAYRLTFLGGFDSGPITVKAQDEIPLATLPFKIKVESVAEDHVAVTLGLAGRTIGPLWVTYFDMPIVDNVKMGEQRVSLILLDSDGETAQLRLVAFDSDLAADRFDVKELARVLKQRQNQ